MSNLRDAYELIKDESRWTRGAFARDARGESVRPLHSTATSWCAAGAIIKATGRGVAWVDNAEGLVLQRVARKMFPEFIAYTELNDELGHEAILQVFEKAIVEEEGSL